MPSSPETRFQELHLTLPPVPKPVAKYKTAVRAGHMLYVSGHGPLKDDKSLIVGKVGKDLNGEQGKAAARQVGLAVLSTVRDTLGSFDKVKRAASDSLADMTFTVKDEKWDARDQNTYVFNSSQGLSTGSTGRYARIVIEKLRHVA